MKPNIKILLTIPFLITSLFVWCKGDTNSVVIKSDSNLTLLNAKYKESQNGKSKGYRIQVFFSAESSKAKDFKQKFQIKYPNIPVYEPFEAPYFKIRAGNFKTKLEAYKILKEINVDFPGCFIVQDEVIVQ